MGECQNLVVVYVSQGPLRAEVARSKLEALQIPVLLRYQALGRILGITVDGLGRVEVLVPEEYQGRAREALREEEDDRADQDVAPGG